MRRLIPSGWGGDLASRLSRTTVLRPISNRPASLRPALELLHLFRLVLLTWRRHLAKALLPAVSTLVSRPFSRYWRPHAGFQRRAIASVWGRRPRPPGSQTRSDQTP